MSQAVVFGAPGGSVGTGQQQEHRQLGVQQLGQLALVLLTRLLPDEPASCGGAVVVAFSRQMLSRTKW
jgi:hypothetical protein